MTMPRLASITIALGDANANGKVDVSVSGSAFGLALQPMTLDLDPAAAFEFVRDLVAKPQPPTK